MNTPEIKDKRDVAQIKVALCMRTTFSKTPTGTSSTSTGRTTGLTAGRNRR